MLGEGTRAQDEHVLDAGDLLARYETSWPQVRSLRTRQGCGPVPPTRRLPPPFPCASPCAPKCHRTRGPSRRAFRRPWHGSVWSATAATSSSAARRAASRPSPCLFARPCVRVRTPRAPSRPHGARLTRRLLGILCVAYFGPLLYAGVALALIAYGFDPTSYRYVGWAEDRGGQGADQGGQGADQGGQGADQGGPAGGG